MASPPSLKLSCVYIVIANQAKQLKWFPVLWNSKNKCWRLFQPLASWTIINYVLYSCSINLLKHIYINCLREQSRDMKLNANAYVVKLTSTSTMYQRLTKNIFRTSFYQKHTNVHVNSFQWNHFWSIYPSYAF